MPAGIFITLQDIRTLFGISKDAASRRLCRARAGLGKPQGKSLTVEEYAGYEMIPLTEVRNALEGKTHVHQNHT